MIIKTNLLIIPIIVTSTLLSVSIRPIQAKQNCTSVISNNTLEWSLSKIKESNLAKLSNISCEEIKSINRMRSEDIMITSGRKRGQSLICLSNDKDYPCKHIIGIINPGFIDTTYALSEIFSFTPEVPEELNETVERLFLKPSSLIQ